MILDPWPTNGRRRRAAFGARRRRVPPKPLPYSPERLTMTTRQRNMRLASTLIGADIKNPAGEDLGTIDDLLVDVGETSGTLAIVKFGGFLGLGSKTYAVPVEAVTADPQGDHFVMAVPVDVIKDAPVFDPERMTDYNEEPTVRAVREHYLRS